MFRGIVELASQVGGRRGLLAISCVVAVVSTLACQQIAGPAAQKPKDEVTLRLDWIPSGTHAYTYLTLDKGHYDEQNLSVKILDGKGSGDTLKLVGNGSDTFGSAEGATMMRAIAEGIPVKMVAAIYPTGGNGIVALKDAGIMRPQDLLGKAVGMPPGSSQFQMWPAFLKVNKLDPDKITIVTMEASAQIPSLLAKKVDAIAIFPKPTIPLVEKQGAQATGFLFADFGVNTFGMGIVANTSTVKEKPDLMKRFVTATLKGFQYAGEHPDEAIASLKRHVANTDEAIAKQVLIANLTMRFTKNTQGQPLGVMSKADWEETQALLAEYGGLKQKTEVTNYFTNDFLPR